MKQDKYKRGSHCPECGKRFKDNRGLNGHLRFSHNMETGEIQEILDEEKAKDETYSKFERVEELHEELKKVRQRMEEVEAYKQEQTSFFSRDKPAEKMEKLLSQEEEKISKQLDELTA